MALLGVFFTWIGYDAARSSYSGEDYFYFIGAIVTGVIIFFIGLSRYFRVKE